LGVHSHSLTASIPAADALARAFRFLGKRWNAVVLAQGGLISRTVDEGPPLAVSYDLTTKGRALMPALEEIAVWARENLTDGAAEHG
jgi:hypothetical protein